MKNKFVKAFLIGVCGLFMTACSGETIEPVNVAIVNGNTANSAVPDYSAAEDYVKLACESAGSVSVISVEGKPVQFAQADIPEAKRGASKENQAKKAMQYTNQIMSLLEQCVPTTEEADVLEAVQLGARALQAKAEGDKYMIVCHSGVQTCGVLNMTESLLEAVDTEKVVQKLAETSELPNMNGIQVYWIGLGDTVLPQKELSSKNKEVLEDLWTTILEKAGAKVTFIKDLPLSDKVREGLPKVSTVEVLQAASVLEVYQPEETIVLEQQVLSFEPGRASLITSESNVKEMLEPMIQYMKETPEYRLLICGTTASAGTRNELETLSEQRCNTVKQILISEGIPADQILIKGLGYEGHPFSVVDTDESGNFIEEQGKKNRNVILMSADSELAQDLLAI